MRNTSRPDARDDEAMEGRARAPCMVSSLACTTELSARLSAPLLSAVKPAPRLVASHVLAASLLALISVLAVAPANAQSASKDLEPAVDTSKSAPASAMEPAVDTSKAPPPSVLEPAVDTSAAPSEESSAAGNNQGAANSAQKGRATAKGGKSMDRLELDTTSITGNRELPKVLYIVPWKRSDLGDLLGKPVNSLLDEVLTPVDRDVFRRENRYFTALDESPGAAAGATSGAGNRAAGALPGGSPTSAVPPTSGAQTAPVAPK